MKPSEIYGLLLIKGQRAPDVARAVGVSRPLVHRVIHGERAEGVDAMRVRAYLVETLGIPDSEIPSEPETTRPDHESH
jgi:hypothetical protein